MKNKIYINDLHLDHKVWRNQLNFQKEELTFFKNRLEEIVSRWTDDEVLQQVEHFQNSFLVQSNKIDELLHGINIHADNLVAEAKSNPTAIDHVHFDDHTTQRDQIETQWKLYNELKEEYLNFLRKVM
ncbi:hypothetical protein [Portibacter lacus]|uniref:Uncharacterized protein n=1 Tax=Portibacter lacus TaxID=1099794 RepID=A0AA37WFB8_9BACT|nr:hypothetical protein [Portibacter lacus]GLR18688.1 hypothetical protein GCM10007940_33040 [Portibacter lacus]